MPSALLRHCRKQKASLPPTSGSEISFQKADVSINAEVDAALLQAPAEQDLYHALSCIAPEAEKAFRDGDYSTSLQILAGLRGPVDGFFDHVMVNTEDESLRHNRLALLAQLQQAMNRVADISRLA